MKTKRTKRIKVWVNDYGKMTGQMYKSRSDAERLAWSIAERTAVPLIELRRGEVVVDVEALVEAFEILDWNTSALFGDPSETLRAALKKVGVR